jgi:hypothetical protein
LVTRKPLEGVAHRLGAQLAGNNAPGLAANDQPGIGQDIQVLHHRRQ